MKCGSWTGWYRHITLAMWALALLTVMRAGTIAVEMLKKSLPSPTLGSPLAAFKVQAWPRLPLSVPELRRLLWRFVLVVPHTVRHILAWSQWRRRHQTIAQYYHYQRRELLVAAVAA